MQRRTFIGGLVALATLGRLPKAKAVPKTIAMKGGGVLPYPMPERVVGDSFKGTRNWHATHRPTEQHVSEIVEFMKGHREQVYNEYIEAAHAGMDIQSIDRCARNNPYLSDDYRARLLARVGTC